MTESARPASSGVARFMDYILGRNTLIGFASLMLLLISGYATWHGMRDFIIGLSSSAAAADPGRLSISNDLLVAVVVIALTFLMWLTLRETFGARRLLRERMITLPFYIFLAIWSVGFGYASGGTSLRAKRRRALVLPASRRMRATPAASSPHASMPSGRH